MQSLKKFHLVIFALIMANNVLAQQHKPVAAVLNMDTENVLMETSEAGNLLRLELDKSDKYNILDRYETNDRVNEHNIDKDCFSRSCLIEAGKAMDVEYLISGSIERFGDKIVVTLRKVSVEEEEIVETKVHEYKNMQNEIQKMIGISVKKFTDTEYDRNTFEILRYVESPIEGSRSLYSSRGPRMGASYVLGDMADRLAAHEENGGWDAYPIMSQFGYQWETEYLSSGNFHALFEILGTMSGMEQGLFIPSITLMNGFRESNYGYEIAFGPSFGLSRVAEGYYHEGNWYSSDARSSEAWENIRNEGDPEENPNRMITRHDSDGSIKPSFGWVWAVGRTFRSGHLNIPVNAYITQPDPRGWQVGVSVGFNMTNYGNN